MTRSHHLGELQLAIVRVLWERGEATASDVHQALEPERGLAPTTIATMLRKMEDKGVVAHREAGRSFVYRALVRSEQVHRRMVGDLVDQLFDGNPMELVNHLVRAGEIDLDELEQLRAMIDAAGQRPAAKPRRRGGRS